MDKNVVLDSLISLLMRQRETLNDELANLNHNDNTYSDRRTTLETAIMNIDTQVINSINSLENDNSREG